MPRPTKTISAIQTEKRTHLTKREIAHRQAAENSMLTGYKIKETHEVKADSIAHKEFKRIKGLLAAINKDDEIYGAPTRRYCINLSKLAAIDEKIDRLRDDIADIERNRDRIIKESSPADYTRLLIAFERIISKWERLAKGIRAEMTDYERNNCMTIKSSLVLSPAKQATAKTRLQDIIRG